MISTNTSLPLTQNFATMNAHLIINETKIASKQRATTTSARNTHYDKEEFELEI